MDNKDDRGQKLKKRKKTGIAPEIKRSEYHPKHQKSEQKIKGDQ